jgi:hypothetical protein
MKYTTQLQATQPPRFGQAETVLAASFNLSALLILSDSTARRKVLAKETLEILKYHCNPLLFNNLRI